MRVNEPALDLALIAAILSSYRGRAIDSKTIVFGEVGLVGEVRAVNMAEQRVSEAAKLGFTRCIMPQTNVESMEIDKELLRGMQLTGIRNVRDLEW